MQICKYATNLTNVQKRDIDYYEAVLQNPEGPDEPSVLSQEIGWEERLQNDLFVSSGT